MNGILIVGIHVQIGHGTCEGVFKITYISPFTMAKTQNIKNLGFFVAPLTLPESRSLRKVTSHVTKNPNNTSEGEASVYIGKKTVKNRRSFKKPHFGGGFFDSGFLQCLGVVA